MPYRITKQKCKQSDGDAGKYVLSYKDKSGKKHRACHTSKKKARGQIAAIEMESVEQQGTTQMKNELKQLIRQLVVEAMLEMEEAAATSKEEMKDDEASNKKSKKKDVTGDGKADFADVMASRMMASGMPKSAAVKKAEKVVKK